MARNDGTLPTRVNGLRTRIDHWRRHRDSRAMPERLWEAAVFLARAHGVSPIARALRLDYGALKRRTVGTKGHTPYKKGATGFVDLGAGPWLGQPTPEEPTVELWGADGCRLVIRLSAGEGTDVLTLAAALWKRR